MCISFQNEAMQFNVVLIFLYLMITFVRTSPEGTCDCTSCTYTAIISAGSEYRIYNSAACSGVTVAAVSDLKVQSTNQRGIQIYTQDDPSSAEYYTAASTASTVTCFNMADGDVVGGRHPRIYVTIQCKEWVQSCEIRYTVNLRCVRVGTTSTIAPTSVSTAKPVGPSTVTSIVVDNICECQCCKGSAGCTPVYVGVIFYGTNRCEPTDCTKQCVKQFPACPASGIEPGKIVTQCRNNADIGLKSSFYILFLTIIFLHTFNIM